MIKVRFIQDYDNFKTGEIVELPKEKAYSLLLGFICVYFYEFEKILLCTKIVHKSY